MFSNKNSSDDQMSNEYMNIQMLQYLFHALITTISLDKITDIIVCQYKIIMKHNL